MATPFYNNVPGQYGDIYAVPSPPLNYGAPGIYNDPSLYARVSVPVPMPPSPVYASLPDTHVQSEMDKEMHENRASDKTRTVLTTIKQTVPGISEKDLRKMIHVFSPGGKLRTWVMLACAFFLLAEFGGFLGIGIALTTGSSATTHAIAVYPYVGLMFSAALFVACGLGVVSREDGVIMLCVIIAGLTFVCSSIIQGFFLWDSASLTTSGCTGAYYPSTILAIFCTHYNITSGNSYFTDPLVVWTEGDARASIIDTTLCRNRSFLWAALFVTCSCYAIHLGLLMALIWYAWSSKISIGDAMSQIWSAGISEEKKDV